MPASDSVLASLVSSSIATACSAIWLVASTIIEFILSLPGFLAPKIVVLFIAVFVQEVYMIYIRKDLTGVVT